MTAKDNDHKRGRPATFGADTNFLLNLARDSSDQARARLADEVSGLCSDARPRLTEQEQDLISAILRKLLAEFELPLRQQLGERLATIENVPHDLIVALANDDIQVARPVLLHSKLLRDAELIEIIRLRGQQHQLAIARRRNLSAPVSEVLVETQDTDVITTLLENPDAEISQATMAYLVEESQRVDSFQEPLVRRDDLSPELAKKLYWWVAAALRQDILEKYDVDPEELDSVIEDSADDVVDLEANPPPPGPNAALRLAKQITKQTSVTPEIVIKVLRQGEIALFEALLGEACGLGSPQLQRVLYAPKGDGLTVMCRAIGFPKQSFATIFMLSRGSGTVLNPKDLARATRLFDNMSIQKAKKILVGWRRNTEFQEAVSVLSAPSVKKRAG